MSKSICGVIICNTASNLSKRTGRTYFNRCTRTLLIPNFSLADINTVFQASYMSSTESCWVSRFLSHSVLFALREKIDEPYRGYFGPGLAFQRSCGGLYLPGQVKQVPACPRLIAAGASSLRQGLGHHLLLLHLVYRVPEWYDKPSLRRTGRFYGLNQNSLQATASQIFHSQRKTVQSGVPAQGSAFASLPSARQIDPSAKPARGQNGFEAIGAGKINTTATLHQSSSPYLSSVFF